MQEYSRSGLLKRKQILRAVDMRFVFAKDIDEATRGTGINRLREYAVSEQKLCEFYDKTLSLLTQEQISLLLQGIEQYDPDQKRVEPASTEEQSNEEQSAPADNSLLAIEKKLDQILFLLLTGESEREKILGFTLTKSGKYWYAVRRNNKEVQSVYIGKNKESAREKIEKHLTKSQE